MIRKSTIMRARRAWARLANLARRLVSGPRAAFGHGLSIYQYHRRLADDSPGCFGPLRIATQAVLGRSARILFYPERPTYQDVIYKTCLLSGHLIVTNPARRFDLAVKWNTRTFAPGDRTLATLAKRGRVLNIACEDISKTRVSEIFLAVFGYTAAVDPLTFIGPCVEKSDLNARHDGRVIECPVSSSRAGCVYQRIINNETGGGLVEDIRVPVFYPEVPLVYLKYRPLTDRFSNTNVRAVIAEPTDTFSREEIAKILALCKALGLDYGELDVLRDRHDQHVYIVDVNPTPWGPPNHISDENARIAVARMAAAFQKVFLSGAPRSGRVAG